LKRWRKKSCRIAHEEFWESPRSLRIWSAGCSTGEEAYSIAMTWLTRWSLPMHGTYTSWPRTSAAGLDPRRAWVYDPRELKQVTPRQREQYFSRTGDHFVVKPRIRNLVTFAPMNLAQVVYMGKFDCIFCMKC